MIQLKFDYPLSEGRVAQFDKGGVAQFDKGVASCDEGGVSQAVTRGGWHTVPPITSHLNAPEITPQEEDISVGDTLSIKERSNMSGREALPDVAAPDNLLMENDQRSVSSTATGKKKRKALKREEEQSGIVKTVMDELNQLINSAYKATSLNTIKYIHARIAEGYTIDDLLAVVRDRVDQWKDDPKMSPYLRPSTMFNSEKFEGYLQQARQPNSQPRSENDLFLEEIKRRRLQLKAES